MSTSFSQPEEQLPGYTLIERIGVGGYGEVWSAHAPGGLEKAIKFVYGNQLDSRAALELSALERIKAVRHPFLLSLERAQIVQDRLLIVMELAQGSLRDRFRECVQEGLPGIPREELIGYLSDAADVLDFLNREHGLAHLDIKPENLLLVGGHAKVGDFGLVKSIRQQAEVSMVNGLTPTYAAPELFSGSPGRASDQYSLAVLYIEMLTGALPFAGANAAELTLQHMKQDPDLASLGEGDRFVISRAMAKSPKHRYETATGMIEALRARDGKGTRFSAETTHRGADAQPTLFSSEETPSRHQATDAFCEVGSAPSGSGSQQSCYKLPSLDQPELVELPTPLLDLKGFTPTPTLFIGIGGTGARVLRSLRRSISRRYDVTDPVASLPMLLLDTDPQTLAMAARGAETGSGLVESELLALPLRRPQEYRDKSDLLLRWLGRRWLYNIPRSLLTEGIRPLGRLALMDHARRSFQRIRGAIADAASEACREKTCEQIGENFGTAGLRVYVIGSSSGGTGSGMLLDIAYAVRSILDRLHIDHAVINGIVTHSSHRDTSRSKLARVNSYAWLSEYQQFLTSEAGYPGDDGFGLPSHKPGVAPFDNTYFLPLGEGLDNAEFELAAEAVAQYVCTDAVSPYQKTLNACRRNSNEEGQHVLRTLSISRNAEPTDAVRLESSQMLLQRLIEGWVIGNPRDARELDSPNSTSRVVTGAVAFMTKHQIDPVSLAASCRTTLEAALGGDVRAFIEGHFGSLKDAPREQVFESVNQLFEMNLATQSPISVQGVPLPRLMDPSLQRITAQVASWVLSRVNLPSERLFGAIESAAWCHDYFTAIRKDLARLSQSLKQQWRATVAEEAAPYDAAMLFRLRLDQAAIGGADTLVAGLLSTLASVTEELSRLRESLEGTLKTIAGEGAATAKFPLSQTDLNRLTATLEERLQTDYFAPSGGLLRSLASESALNELRRTLQHAVGQVLDEDPAFAAAGESLTTGLHLQREEDQASFILQGLNGCGGSFQRVSMAPNQADEKPGNACSIVEISEVWGISLPHVASLLIDARHDYAALAERVRTRRDTPWKDPVGELAQFESMAPVSDTLCLDSPQLTH